MTPRPSRCAQALAAIVALAWVAPGQAAVCTINAQGVSFGNYDPFASADLDSVGNLRLECDAAVNAEVSLSSGAGTFTTRQMGNGTSQLGYNLFTSSQRTTVWGDGTGGSSTVSVSMQSGDIPVYATVPALQNVTVGTYEDTIVVTVTY